MIYSGRLKSLSRTSPCFSKSLAIVIICTVLFFTAYIVKEGRQVDINKIASSYSHWELPFLNQLSSNASASENNNNCSLDYINRRRLRQDDVCIIQLIRHHYLRKPSPFNVDYNLSHPETMDPSAGQTKDFIPIFKKKNGFFIECGAHDGEHLSNTLYMERYLNWTGILIEAEQGSFHNLMHKNRKAWALPVCISPKPYPIQVTFNGSQKTGSKIASDNDAISLITSPPVSNVYKLQCFPLYSILLAVGQTTIDLFSLDVEGFELDVLQTIPWDKVDIKVLTVEWNKKINKAMPDYMKSVGYRIVKEVQYSYGDDLIFKKIKSN